MTMARRYMVYVCGLVSVFVLLIGPSVGEIHRAKAIKTKYGAVAPVLPRFPPSAFSDFDEEVKLADSDRDPEPDPERNLTLFGHSTETWTLSMVSAMLVGLSGIFPLIVIPIETGKNLHQGAAAARLRLLLSFAVGGLLGDVFLHLLPEAWAHLRAGEEHRCHMEIGRWVLTGLFCFLIIEKIFPDNPDEDECSEDEYSSEEDTTTDTKLPNQLNGVPRAAAILNGQDVDLRARLHRGLGDGEGSLKKNSCLKNGHVPNGLHSNGIRHGADNKTGRKKTRSDESATTIKTSGWLNLMANVIDNFTHGLAVAGSYCISTKTGLITTVAVLLHEVPHEIGDFAILLRSGFDRWKAAKAQLLTASGGLLGAIAALSSESAEIAGDRTAWILPFTSGGFIYIALVTVVPDLLKETNKCESIKQMLCLLCGITMVAGVTLLCE